MLSPRLHALAIAFLAACAGCGTADPSPALDAATDRAAVPDAAPPDGAPADAAPADGPPRDAHRLAGDGAPAASAPVSLVEGVFAVPVVVNGVAGPPLLVDTGTPVTYVDAARFPGADVATGRTTVATFALGGLTLRDAPVIGHAILGADSPAAGLLGADILCEFTATFDYRARRLVLGDAPLPAGVEATGAEVPFRLAGGGRARVTGAGGSITVPPTRVAVSATVEGAERTLMVDTGASLMILRASVVDALAADGRGTLALPVGMHGSTVTATTARLRSVRVASAEVTGAPVTALPDATLDALGLEVGRTVDGLVGAAFLREFLTTVDYPRGVLRLRRYADRAHVEDEFRRVGVLLRAEGAGATRGYVIDHVFAGTDAAARGLRAGGAVTSVDGRSLATLDADTADRLLRGAAGARRVLRVDGRDVEARVEELLPLP